MHILYSVVLALGFVLGLPWFLWKGRSSGKYLRTFRERMGRLPVYLNLDGDRSIWIHAVSVGEVLAARPLVPALRERFPGHRIFLSTTTLTGNEVAKKSVRGLDGLFFAPFDFPHAVRRALEVVNPSLLVLVETELWPNLIHEASRRGARVAVVNGRISPRSFPRYRRMRRFLSRVLSEIDLFLMQGETARRAHPRAWRAPAGAGAGHGQPEVRRGRGRPPARAPGAPAARRLATRRSGWRAAPWRARRSWCCGRSTACASACRTRACCSPRATRSASAWSRASSRPPASAACGAARSTPPRGPTARCCCSTRSASWRSVYSLASVVFVGGSLVPSGGHNILEPAVAGKPVVVGPHMENFQEIADTFRAESALVQVGSADELGREVRRSCSTSRAGATSASGRAAWWSATAAP